MAYSLKKPTGSYGLNPIPVVDNQINKNLYDSNSNVGVLLVGRNAIDYGEPIAQNIVQMTSNFAGSVTPKPDIALQGQLWYNTTSETTGLLFVRKTALNAGMPTQAADIAQNWDRVVTVPSTQTGTIPVVNPSGTPKDGDILIQTPPTVPTTTISIWAGGLAGSWKQIFPAQYS